MFNFEIKSDGVNGWLHFMISFMLVNIFLDIYSLLFDISKNIYLDLFGYIWLASRLVGLTIFLNLIYSNSIFLKWAKIYLVFDIILNYFYFQSIFGGMENFFSLFLKSVIVSIIALIYFLFSSQVKETFVNNFRKVKVTRKSWEFTISIISVFFIISFFLGSAFVGEINESDSEKIAHYYLEFCDDYCSKYNNYESPSVNFKQIIPREVTCTCSDSDNVKISSLILEKDLTVTKRMALLKKINN